MAPSRSTPREQRSATKQGDHRQLGHQGIEAKSDLVISGGSISITTADDCLNAGDSITINDGSLYCVSSDNNAIDSNGTMTINGGQTAAGSDQAT